jgi:hypothetical protein
MYLEQVMGPFGAYLAGQRRSAMNRHGQAQQDLYTRIRDLLQQRENPPGTQPYPIPAQTTSYPYGSWNI